MLFFAASEAPPRPESMKFPVNSLLAGNLAFSETSSQLTPPSSGESRANLSFFDYGAWHSSASWPDRSRLSRGSSYLPRIFRGPRHSKAILTSGSCALSPLRSWIAGGLVQWSVQMHGGGEIRFQRGPGVAIQSAAGAGSADW